MNKNILIAGGAVLVIAVVAFIFLNSNSSKTLSDTQNSNSLEQISDIALSAFEGNGSVKCSFEDENSQGTAYIKNGMVKVEGTGTDEAQYGNVIMKNDTVWTWGTDGNKGFMMENVSKYQADANTPAQYNVDANQVRDRITQNKPNCSAQNIPDSTFDPPADITFQSMDSMMEDIETQLPDGFELPEGVELPEGFELPSN